MEQRLSDFTYSRDIHRGEIFYVFPKEIVGNEQGGGRPVIIVSNDDCNKAAGYVTAVCVTSKDKTPLPTHVIIPEDTDMPIYGTILCESVQQVSKLRLGDYVGDCPEDLMRQIEQAICIQCGIDNKVRTVEKEVIKTVEIPDAKATAEIERLKLELIKTQERLSVFRELYTEALKR